MTDRERWTREFARVSAQLADVTAQIALDGWTQARHDHKRALRQRAGELQIALAHDANPAARYRVECREHIESYPDPYCTDCGDSVALPEIFERDGFAIADRAYRLEIGEHFDVEPPPDAPEDSDAWHAPARIARLPEPPACGHSVCRQNWIDDGENAGACCAGMPDTDSEQIRRDEAQRELLDATRALVIAAQNRENTQGDPIGLLNAQRELREATAHARAVCAACIEAAESDLGSVDYADEPRPPIAAPEDCTAADHDGDAERDTLAAWDGIHAWAALTEYGDDADGLLEDVEDVALRCTGPSAQRVARAAAILLARVRAIAGEGGDALAVPEADR